MAVEPEKASISRNEPGPGHSSPAGPDLRVEIARMQQAVCLVLLREPENYRLLMKMLAVLVDLKVAYLESNQK